MTNEKNEYDAQEECYKKQTKYVPTEIAQKRQNTVMTFALLLARSLFTTSVDECFLVYFLFLAYSPRRFSSHTHSALCSLTHTTIEDLLP